MPASSLLRDLSRFFAVFLFAALTFCSTRAHAAESGPFVVTMRNAQTFSGMLELADLDHEFFKITLADSKIITLPSREVSRIERVAPLDPSPPLVHDDPSVGIVHAIFDANANVALEKKAGDEWENMCTGRCEVDLPRANVYRIRGGGIRNSMPFGLTGKENDTVVLRAKTHSRAALGLGITLMSIGSVFATAAYGHLNTCEEYDSRCTGGASEAAWTFISLGSLSAATIGTVLVALNPKSKVLQHVAHIAQSASPIYATDSAPARTASFRPFAPSFVRPAPTSTLFTIHF